VGVLVVDEQRDCVGDAVVVVVADRVDVGGDAVRLREVGHGSTLAPARSP